MYFQRGMRVVLLFGVVESLFTLSRLLIYNFYDSNCTSSSSSFFVSWTSFFWFWIFVCLFVDPFRVSFGCGSHHHWRSQTNVSSYHLYSCFLWSSNYHVQWIKHSSFSLSSLFELYFVYDFVIVWLCWWGICRDEIRRNVTTFTVITSLLYLIYSCGMETGGFFSDNFVGMHIWHFILMIPGWILDGFTYSFVIYFQLHHSKTTN